MATGEGRRWWQRWGLSAISRGAVHLVTVNDYPQAATPNEADLPGLGTDVGRSRRI
jgi:hypothetical protein